MIQKKRRNSISNTALGRRQGEISEQERALHRKMEQLERVLEEAPRIKEKVHRKERDELLERAATDPTRRDPFHSLGSEYGRDPRRAKTHRVSLKTERVAERNQFILLLLILFLIGMMVLSRLPT